jgi:hypothetical protein
MPSVLHTSVFCRRDPPGGWQHQGFRRAPTFDIIETGERQLHSPRRPRRCSSTTRAGSATVRCDNSRDDCYHQRRRWSLTDGDGEQRARFVALGCSPRRYPPLPEVRHVCTPSMRYNDMADVPTTICLLFTCTHVGSAPCPVRLFPLL